MNQKAGSGVRALSSGLMSGFAMAVLVFTASQAPSAFAEDEPDLVLEVASKPDQANPRRVVFKVTNKSPFWANETTARVATVYTGPRSGLIQMFPPPTNIKDNIFIENLDPGQTTLFEYILGGDCDGHELDVEVRPARSWDDTPELNQANNKLDNFQLCVSTQRVGSDTYIPPQDNDDNDPFISVGGCAKCGEVPAAKEPQWVTIPKAHHRTFIRTTEGPPLFDQGTDDGVAYVGFFQYEGGRADRGALFSLGINFENKGLQGVTPSNFMEAQITYREAEADFNAEYRGWTDGGGKFQTKAGCVGRLDITATIQTQGEFVSNQIRSVNPADRIIDISESFKTELEHPSRPGAGYNYVLRGTATSANVDDETSCVSTLSDVNLRVKYRPN